MNRNNLISLIILDIIVMLLAAGLLFYRYKTISGMPINLMPTAKIAKTDKPADNNIENIKNVLYESGNTKADAEVKTEAIPAKEAQPVLPAANSKKRNIRFTFKHSKVKKVQIMGDFNTWIPQFMTRKGNIWSITIPIAPGDYAYNFVADGKPIRDPNNLKTCDAGRGFTNSLLKVVSLNEREKKE